MCSKVNKSHKKVFNLVKKRQLNFHVYPVTLIFSLSENQYPVVQNLTKLLANVRLKVISRNMANSQIH